ncbi:MAG: dTMP kinase [Rhodospirillales bacterium]|nr:dTMP kinase [Rhodospirillales bacterium]MCW8951358.1 dTMP kinase [Rhodospirillales bacterium]MCW8970678.1 dTMP kinase [Rhodospirillales bacterium]MCW9002024.1 dTMP kinase [Rhodospirillales bacterium]
MTHGQFITIEGGEGSGKSTQISLLCDALTSIGTVVLRTREPGGSPGAEEIRDLLVNGGVDRWDAMTETLLHFAARRDHLVKTVWPALEGGSWVISDRFSDSTTAYQGYGHGLGPELVGAFYDAVVGDFRPDLTLILDIPVEEGLRRARSRNGGEDRYERMDISFHERIRQAFLDIAKCNADRCVVMDASSGIEGVQSAIRKEISNRFGTVFP